jgi:GNAT superfamily N-acetyltransferase
MSWVSLSSVSTTDAVALWNEFYPDKYAIDESVFRLNTLENPFKWLEGARALTDNGSLRGYAVLKRSGYGFYPGAEPTVCHLSAFAYSDEQAGRALLEDAIGAARGEGMKVLHFGADTRHFWPGVPKEMTALQDLLAEYGFVANGFAVDLEADLETYETPPHTYAKMGDAQLRACTKADIPLLEEFLHREFPRRWWYDVMQKIRIEENPGCVFAVFVGDSCEGFAITQEDGCRMPIAGGIWYRDLGPKWGSLGPIGVSERVRGRGLGGALLGFGLEGLKARGVRRCIIDWTTLVEFYGKFGFEVNREYVPMRLEL